MFQKITSVIPQPGNFLFDFVGEKIKFKNVLQSNVTYPTTSGPSPCWITEYVGLTPYLYVGLLRIAACTCIVLLYYMFCAVGRRLPCHMHVSLHRRSDEIV